MVVLAIDTSQRIGAVALARDGDLLAEEPFGAEASHLVELGRAIEAMLARAGLTRRDIDRVALVSGPGSFTGLRIGMAFVKGLHAGLGVELVTIGTLELLALPLLESYPTVAPLLDARKREVYAAVYGRPAAGPAPFVAAREIVAPCAQAAGVFLSGLRALPAAIVGSGAVHYHDDVARLAPDAALPEPVDMAPPVGHLARVAHRLDPLSEAAVRALEPDYVRSSEAELKRLRETRR